ncbi:hypothetical protein N9V18_04910 [bacterium]|nr:hypothetical protein [bacterium]NSW96852.1 hypothetical protein [bacterium]|tara:strand:+ start:5604 stop:5957 length:354 start_codon:yes stop_codon:yes gene_type:complete
MSQYRKGYIFEKKSNSYIQEILETFKNLKFYSIESRGSKGTADIVFGIYDIKKKNRTWFGVQCKRGYISGPEKKREIEKASKISGMKLFFSSPKKEKKTEILIEPDLKDWIQEWLKD